MTFYSGIDLHSKKSHVCVIDKDGKKVKEENLNNDLALILQFHNRAFLPERQQFQDLERRDYVSHHQENYTQPKALGKRQQAEKILLPDSRQEYFRSRYSYPSQM